MEEFLNAIQKVIDDEYSKMKESGRILFGIADLDRQLRWRHPKLATYVKEEMLYRARKDGILP